MSVIGNFNGSPIIATPSSPAFREIDWTAIDTVAVATAPFTQQQKAQNWQASLLTGTVTLPPMKRRDANAWIAFMLECQGQSACFFIGDSAGGVPLGTAEGSPMTSGSVQQGYSLATTGWTPNQPSLLEVGDYVQAGLRLFRCLTAASSDGNGNSTFTIWPQVREPMPNGTPLIITNPVGLFRLATNQRSSSESYLTTYGLSF